MYQTCILTLIKVLITVEIESCPSPFVRHIIREKSSKYKFLIPEYHAIFHTRKDELHKHAEKRILTILFINKCLRFVNIQFIHIFWKKVILQRLLGLWRRSLQEDTPM